MAFLGLEMVLDEALGFVEGRRSFEDPLTAQKRERVVVYGERVTLEAVEHDICLNERVDVWQFAQELTRVTLAHGLQPVEAERVLALKDVVERLGDHGDPPLNLR